MKIYKLKYTKYIMIVFLVISFFSCNDDYLVKFPINTPSSSTFIQTEGELEFAINGAYQNMGARTIQSLPIEGFLDSWSDIGWDRVELNSQSLGNGNANSANGFLLNVWRWAYNGIQRCNFILENADRITDIKNQAKFDQILAEAKFIRAYYYYHLIELFGGVPLVTSPLALEDSYIERTDKQEIVDFLLSDLENAAGKLPKTYSGKDKGRATQDAALALKGRIALFNEKWEIAIDATVRVMGNNVYGLDPDFDALYYKSTQDVSPEIIFKHDYLDGVAVTSAGYWYGSRMASGVSGLIPTQMIIDSYLCKDGLTIDKSPLYDPSKPFQDRDPRMQSSLILPGSIFCGFKYETHRDSVLTFNYNLTPPKRVTNQDAVSQWASFSGYCWRKYADMTNPIYRTRSEIGHIVLRYAEVLLNYAEAKIESNSIDQSVYDAINEIRVRAGIPEVSTGKTQSELRSIVRIERKTELANEGQRLYDIRRWKIAEVVLNRPVNGRIQRGLLASAPTIDENGTPDYSIVPNASEMRLVESRTFNSSKNYLFPIPQIEIDINPKIVQNPNY